MSWLVSMDWNQLVTNSLAILGALQIILTALIGIFMLIPGAEPERTLLKVHEFISRFSRKPVQKQVMLMNTEPPKQEQTVPTVSTFEVVKMVIALIFKLTNVFAEMAKDKDFTDWVNDLDAATKELKDAKTLNDRVNAASKFNRIARRM